MSTPSPEVADLLRRLGDVTGVGVRPATLSVELTRSVQSLRGLFASAAASVALVEPDGQSLRFMAADGAGAEAIVGVQLPLGRGIAGWVALSGQEIAVQDVQRDTRFARDVAESTDYLPTVILAAPIMDDSDEVLGIVEVLDPASSEQDTGRQLLILGTLASQLSSVVRLAQVYDGLGTALLRAVSQAGDPESFTRALEELAAAEPASEDLQVAAAFHRLAAQGPEAADLARTVLTAVAAFTKRRR